MAPNFIEKAGKSWAQLLKSYSSREIFSEFEKKKTLEDKFVYVWDLPGMRELLALTIVKSEKSATEADRLRSEGNAHYKAKNFGKALKFFNLSVMAAPHPVLQEDVTVSVQERPHDGSCFDYPSIDPSRYGGVAESESKALSVGYANRSAVMFEMGFHKKCLEDINLAFAYGYPDEFHGKLNKRKEKCLKALSMSLFKHKQPHNLGKLVQTEDFLKELNLNPFHQSTTSIYDDLFSKRIQLKDILALEKLYPPKLTEPNPQIPALSDTVSIGYTPLMGRSIVASKNIRTGELIGVEEACCASLQWNMLETYCSFCLQLCLNPVPCPSCCKVVYCNESCRKKALSGDHWLECSILPTLIAYDINFDYGHRLLKSIPCSLLKKMVEELHRESCSSNSSNGEKRGFSSDGVYHSNSYQAVYHLSSGTDIDMGDLFFKCQQSVAITQLLEQSGRYFLDRKNQAVTPSRDDIIKTGATLILHMIKEHFNTFAIGDQLDKLTATGVFPTISLLNHSCNRNAYHYSNGRNLIVRAVKPIKSGDEVTVSYTGSFGYFSREMREKQLSIRRIECHCEACENRWPMIADLPILYYKCARCSRPGENDVMFCGDCLPRTDSTVSDNRETEGLPKMFNRTLQVGEALKKANEIAKAIESGDELDKEDFTTLCNTSDLLYSHFAEPCRMLCRVSEYLDRSFRYIL